MTETLTLPKLSRKASTPSKTADGGFNWGWAPRPILVESRLLASRNIKGRKRGRRLFEIPSDVFGQ